MPLFAASIPKQYEFAAFAGTVPLEHTQVVPPPSDDPPPFPAWFEAPAAITVNFPVLSSSPLLTGADDEPYTM
jgi:hypothetical protein